MRSRGNNRCSRSQRRYSDRDPDESQGGSTGLNESPVEGIADESRTSFSATTDREAAPYEGQLTSENSQLLRDTARRVELLEENYEKRLEREKEEKRVLEDKNRALAVSLEEAREKQRQKTRERNHRRRLKKTLDRQEAEAEAEAEAAVRERSRSTSRRGRETATTERMPDLRSRGRSELRDRQEDGHRGYERDDYRNNGNRTNGDHRQWNNSSYANDWNERRADSRSRRRGRDSHYRNGYNDRDYNDREGYEGDWDGDRDWRRNNY